MGIGARDLFAVVLFGCKIVPLSRVRIKHPTVLLVVEAPMGFFFPVLPSSAGFGLLLFPGIGCHFLIYPKKNKKGYSQIINFPKRLFSNVLRKKKTSLGVDSLSLEESKLRLDELGAPWDAGTGPWWN